MTTLDDLAEGQRRQDQTLDRILGILQEHGRDLAQLRVDVNQIRHDVSYLTEQLVAHLNWHVGRSA